MQFITLNTGHKTIIPKCTTNLNESIKINIYDLDAQIFIIRMSLRDVIFQQRNSSCSAL